jgi:hypothetical protein
MHAGVSWLGRWVVGMGMLATLGGCETLKKTGLQASRADWQRDQQKEEIAELERAQEDPGAGSEIEREAKGIFKGSRLPGGLSEEAREIERSFNIR